MKRGGTILYDGYCNLCSRTVKRVIRNDPSSRFSFEPLPQEVEAESVVLLTGGRRYEKSTAALRIALGLRFPWPLLGIFFLVPRFLRDPVYAWVARNRKRWFGTRDTCYIPGPGSG